MTKWSIQARMEGTDQWLDCGAVTHERAVRQLIALVESRQLHKVQLGVPVKVFTRDVASPNRVFDFEVSIEHVVHVKALRHDQDATS